MSDTDKLTAARRALAQIADQCTKAFFEADASTMTPAAIYGSALVIIRELAQDAAEATLDKVETRTRECRHDWRPNNLGATEEFCLLCYAIREVPR